MKSNLKKFNENLLKSKFINNVIKGDSLEEMKLIPNNSVDMVLVDLPYGTTQNKWDSIIPLEQLWEQYHRPSPRRPQGSRPTSTPSADSRPQPNGSKTSLHRPERQSHRDKNREVHRP